MILIDTREKKIDHIKRYFDQHGIEYRMEKLDTGDYMDEDNPGVIVDRKQNLEECARNLTSPDSSRFWRELRRAHEARTKLIFLVEHGRDIETINDVVKWSSKFSRVSGRRVYDEMFKAHLAYGVDWKFCQKRSTGRRIIEILGG